MGALRQPRHILKNVSNMFEVIMARIHGGVIGGGRDSLVLIHSDPLQPDGVACSVLYVDCSTNRRRREKFSLSFLDETRRFPSRHTHIRPTGFGLRTF